MFQHILHGAVVGDVSLNPGGFEGREGVWSVASADDGLCALIRDELYGLRASAAAGIGRGVGECLGFPGFSIDQDEKSARPKRGLKGCSSLSPLAVMIIFIMGFLFAQVTVTIIR